MWLHTPGRPSITVTHLDPGPSRDDVHLDEGDKDAALEGLKAHDAQRRMSPREQLRRIHLCTTAPVLI